MNLANVVSRIQLLTDSTMITLGPNTGPPRTPVVIPELFFDGSGFSSTQDLAVENNGHIYTIYRNLGHHTPAQDSIARLTFNQTVHAFAAGLVGSNYRSVANRIDWRQMYGLKPRGMPRHVRGGYCIQETTESFACHYCGWLYPRSALQIDHQHPQNGGAGHALMKAMRAYGMTDDGPAGNKGVSLNTGTIQRVWPQCQPGDPAPSLHTQRTITRTGSMGRYTVNALGRLFLAAVLHVENEIDSLKNAALNHIANLAPSCARCNGAGGKGDNVKAVVA